MKAKIFILVLFFSGFFTCCSKDYPDDIPQWVKNKIKEGKRSTNCSWIKELAKGDSIAYQLSVGNVYSDEWVLYDYDGNIICIYQLTCASTNGYIFRREIWHQIKSRCQ